MRQSVSKPKKNRRKSALATPSDYRKVIRRIESLTKSWKPDAGRTAADDVATYRRMLDRQMWLENMHDSDAATRQTAELITKSSSYRGPNPVLTPCQPWNPAERELAWKAEFGFKEDL